jgi:hypothetical protein
MCSRFAVATAALILALLVGILAPASVSQGKEAQLNTEAGEWRGDAIALRWRESRRTAYEPETVIFVENVISEPVVVVFDWESRVCGGIPSYPSGSAGSFVHALFAAELGIKSTLKPGQWDALMFPRALPLQQPLESAGGCTTRIRLRTIGTESTQDTVDLTLPAPLPPPGKHE